MEKLLSIVKNFRKPRILIVGDLMLDEYIWGDVNRVSPEAPIPVLDVKDITFIPGGAANTANNIKTLGGKVVLVGIVGQDEKGRILIELLKEKGIDIEGVVLDKNRKTTLKTRAVARDQHIVRIDQENREPIDKDAENKILNFIKSRLKEIDSIIISDYLKGVVTLDLAKSIIALCRENNIPCLADAKGDDYSRYENCHLLTPNEKELAFALNLKIDNDERLLTAGKKILSEFSCDNVLVKQGKQGMTLFEKNGDIFHFPAVNKKAKDVSGAGDTSIAVLALSLASGAEPREAVILASHACGVAVGKVGTAVVLPEELENSLKNNSSLYVARQD